MVPVEIVLAPLPNIPVQVVKGSVPESRNMRCRWALRKGPGRLRCTSWQRAVAGDRRELPVDDATGLLTKRWTKVTVRRGRVASAAGREGIPVERAVD